MGRRKGADTFHSLTQYQLFQTLLAPCVPALTVSWLSCSRCSAQCSKRLSVQLTCHRLRWCSLVTHYCCRPKAPKLHGHMVASCSTSVNPHFLYILCFKWPRSLFKDRPWGFSGLPSGFQTHSAFKPTSFRWMCNTLSRSWARIGHHSVLWNRSWSKASFPTSLASGMCFQSVSFTNSMQSKHLCCQPPMFLWA